MPGFAIAVIVGFLYTAAKNWTGLATPHGPHLAALAALWFAGRLAMLWAPEAMAAPVDLLFLPCAAWPLYCVLQRAGNKRNLFLIALLGVLFLANLVFHAALLGMLSLSPIRAVHAAILVIVLIESVMGGRVIPGFTANAVPRTTPVVNVKRDRISIGVTVCAIVGWILEVPPALGALLAFAAACTQIVRLAGWKSYRTRHHPLVWTLHVSYAWIPLGFLLLAGCALGFVPASAAFHALTVGSMAGLIISMMTRTALGHTGRMLKAGKAETTLYLLIQCAAVSRLIAASGLSEWRNGALIIAGICWSAGFLLYAITYGPYLFRARADGREG